MFAVNFNLRRYIGGYPLRVFFARESFDRDRNLCVSFDLNHPGGAS